MSIVHTLRKIVDPIKARQEEQERKAARELPLRSNEGAPPRFVCRVCGRQDIQKAYCPDCLADTMKPLTER